MHYDSAYVFLLLPASKADIRSRSLSLALVNPLERTDRAPTPMCSFALFNLGPR